MRDVVQILTVADQVVKAIIRLVNSEGQERTGAYLCVIDRETHQLILHALIGDGPPDKVSKWREFSAEKCVRLLGHPEHETSFDSRSPDDNRWGGAVLGTDYAFGLSGLKELDDEAAMFHLAVMLNQRDGQATLSVISEERNPQLHHYVTGINWD
jgi:hypothetical protein